MILLSPLLILWEYIQNFISTEISEISPKYKDPYKLKHFFYLKNLV